MKPSEDAERPISLKIRDAGPADLDAVIDIDAQISGIAKSDFWRDTFDLFRKPKHSTYFLAAEYEGRTVCAR